MIASKRHVTMTLSILLACADSGTRTGAAMTVTDGDGTFLDLETELVDVDGRLSLLVNALVEAPDDTCRLGSVIRGGSWITGGNEDDTLSLGVFSRGWGSCCHGESGEHLTRRGPPSGAHSVTFPSEETGWDFDALEGVLWSIDLAGAARLTLDLRGENPVLDLAPSG